MATNFKEVAGSPTEEMGRDEIWINSQVETYRALAKEYFFNRE